MIVLDASFLVKLVLEEEGSDTARELLRLWVRSMEALVTVDLALPEALNAIWKHSSRIGDLSQEEAMESAADFLRIWDKLKVIPSVELAKKALKLALEEDITVYDALYLQLAKSAGAGLATFDGRLSDVAKEHGIETYPKTKNSNIA